MNFPRHFLFGLVLSFFMVGTAHAATFVTPVEIGDLKANVVETEHFEIEYADIIAEQKDSDDDGIADVVELVAEAAEDSWETFVEDLGYDEPMADGVKFILILDDNDQYLYPGTIGVASVFSPGNPYVAVDPWIDSEVLRATVAHEFFHGIQFHYSLGFASTSHGVAFGESTAVWAEDIAFDEINDYVYYLDDYFSYPDYSIFSVIVPEDSLFVYGLGIWPIFLTEYYDATIIGDVWDNYRNSSLDDSDHMKVYLAYRDAIAARGDLIQDLFMEFMLWNIDSRQYSEGADYPDVTSLLEPVEGEYTEIIPMYSPTLYGGNYLYFANNEEDDAFTFHAVMPEGISYGIMLVPYDAGEADLESMIGVQVGLGVSWEEGISLEGLSNVDGVVAVVVPLEKDFDAALSTDYVFDDAYSYAYYGEYADEPLENSAEDVEVTEETGEKLGEEADHSDEIRAEVSLDLSVHNYNENSVTFSWRRPSWSGLAGYELRYGTESGEYTEVKIIDKPYQTIGTVKNLEPNAKVYFQLVGVNDSGKVLKEASNEIAVTPKEWLFTDLSYVNAHYEPVAALVEKGVFQGYEDGSFGVDGSINRAELLKILMEGRGISPDAEMYKNCFSDVQDQWFAKYVCFAKDKDWVGGYGDGTFRPGNTVSKVEALKILFMSYEVSLPEEGSFVAGVQFDDVAPRAWYAVYVGHATSLGILSETYGDDFDPNEQRTRGQMASQLYRYLAVSGLL